MDPVLLEDACIVDVWKDNLDAEMQRIREIVETHPVLGMDTEFPGEVYFPPRYPTGNYQYERLKGNVDRLNIIQLGLTFATPEGQLARPTCTWQFNFLFDVDVDESSSESIKLLTHAGIDLSRNKTEGIDPTYFAELLTTSGVVLNDDVTWTTFHSGYDFGYLLKILTCSELPPTDNDFRHLMDLFFPTIFDLKIVSGTKSGLNKLADDMRVRRLGTMHQAGSDSMVTCLTFFKYVERELQGTIDKKYNGKVAGLGMDLGILDPSYEFYLGQHGMGVYGGMGAATGFPAIPGMGQAMGAAGGMMGEMHAPGDSRQEQWGMGAGKGM
ncbi:putative CAF1 family ribonuclease containing protein [Monocercomonoides exilis]|uniref:putative CAF1 family ribonuclease containing protein n=1 Tax=Monocercomonoides exilis TaxID=2049356 RepID=UPI00355A2E36|nr:putative CAF1 family ribonuclease containing protein [Monocercomonoides exilis]|eukprot:MONOS_7040.1-p1 / transcript=MONOS_7040.1 / gene=MONOS_7040 / organism=Monocercomonoides_exilis_PA203 / gene_product=CAF1 family ribonuclease containing protein / transcript_product=CAF1 family ribonuclease containing protein / location=Mono_scaffold00232:26124-27189(-) / protein_length=325 / sequence_SO=supercontig / SO=protein_coding / is_pseudo=false